MCLSERLSRRRAALSCVCRRGRTDGWENCFLLLMSSTRPWFALWWLLRLYAQRIQLYNGNFVWKKKKHETVRKLRPSIVIAVTEIFSLSWNSVGTLTSVWIYAVFLWREWTCRVNRDVCWLKKMTHSSQHGLSSHTLWMELALLSSLQWQRQLPEKAV